MSAGLSAAAIMLGAYVAGLVWIAWWIGRNRRRDDEPVELVLTERDKLDPKIAFLFPDRPQSTHGTPPSGGDQ